MLHDTALSSNMCRGARGFHSPHPPLTADQAGDGERMAPDVGTDIDHVVARPAEPAEQGRLPRTPFAVVPDAATDIPSP